MSEAKYCCEEDMLCGVNVPKDEKNLMDLEKKHSSIVEAPPEIDQNETFEVNIRIGGGIDGVKHPNEPVHFIEWVELYSGGTSYALAKFKVKLSYAHGPLKIWAKCNIHGLWESLKDIKVVCS